MEIGVSKMTSIKVVFFASLKDGVGMSDCIIDADLPISIAELKAVLADHLDNGQILLKDGVQSSVDFEFTRDSDLVTAGVREVAFFPPVTGG
mgnify:CR=1 FL=1